MSNLEEKQNELTILDTNAISSKINTVSEYK